MIRVTCSDHNSSVDELNTSATWRQRFMKNLMKESSASTVCSTVCSSIEDDDESFSCMFMSASSFEITTKSVRFNENVTVHQSDKLLTEDEKKAAFYCKKDFDRFARSDKILAKYIRGVTKRNGSDCLDLLEDDDISIRGIETSMSQTAKSDARSRRVEVLQAIFDEQESQRSNSYDVNVQYNFMKFRKVSLTKSKTSKQIALELGEKDAKAAAAAVGDVLLQLRKQLTAPKPVAAVEPIKSTTNNETICRLPTIDATPKASTQLRMDTTTRCMPHIQHEHYRF